MTNQIDPLLLDWVHEPRRACGTRKYNMIYVVNNKPSRAHREGKIPLDLRYLLLCPVWQPWKEMAGGTPAMFGLAAQGMLILERRDMDGKGLGVWDLYDLIGSEYPTVPDFYTEMCYFGKSRLIPSNSQFGLLSPESYHFLGHSKAKLVDPLELFYRDRLGLMKCPSHSALHDEPDLSMGIFDSCTGLLWEAVGFQKKDEARLHTVELPPQRPKDEEPSCTYQAGSIPLGVKPLFEVGFWAADRISHYEIIYDPCSDKYLERARIIEESGSQIPYQIVEE